MPANVDAFAFVVLALAAVGGSVALMLTRNVVHAAFWLLEVLLATAGLYLLLSAEFLALVQVMVYAGAVSVLVLFVIMLTLRRREDARRPLDASPLVAAMSVAFGGVLVFALSGLKPAIAGMPAKAPGVRELGELLFSRWVLPFEIASGILLVALVGAVWWAGRGDEL
jgi:NADH-quinone oxidoreductase subunit J